jgi:hypothetical protein
MGANPDTAHRAVATTVLEIDGEKRTQVLGGSNRAKFTFWAEIVQISHGRRRAKLRNEPKLLGREARLTGRFAL